MNPLIAVLCALVVLLPGCAAPKESSPPAEGPRLRVLGIAQDGGLPHAACRCERCEAARTDEARRHHVCSLGLLVPGEERTQVFLVEATPDLREQLVLLRDVRKPPPGRVDRAPLDGVIVTHAHIGHYLGLAFLGFESVHVRGLPLWCSPRMATFLRENGPWSQLVSMKNVALQELRPGESVVPAPGVRLRSITVPHRDEYSDTLAFVFEAEAGVEGERPRRVLFMPDTEPWGRWKTPLFELLDRERIDVFLVDGTFFSAEELPGRAVSSIGHPLMRDTMDLLEDRVRSGKLEVVFLHLNHSNPALDPESAASAELRRRGFRVAREGEEIPLRLSPATER